MANPQVENGHLDIANELAEAFARIHLTGNEWQVLWVILRKTYGWHKKSDRIPVSQIIEATGLINPRVCEALGGLVRKSVLFKVNKQYGLIKDYELWDSTEKRTNENVRKRVQNVRKSVQKRTEKRALKRKKETIQKKTIVFALNSEPYRLSGLLLALIIKNNPKSRLANLTAGDVEKQIQGWSKDIDLMLRVDKRTPADAEEVIRFSQQDNFWRANILSTTKLRKQFDQLYLKMHPGTPTHTPDKKELEGRLDRAEAHLKRMVDAGVSEVSIQQQQVHVDKLKADLREA